MALINCPECESQVSSRAHACPRCGFPIDELVPPPQEMIPVKVPPPQPQPSKIVSDIQSKASTRTSEKPELSPQESISPIIDPLVDPIIDPLVDPIIDPPKIVKQQDPPKIAVQPGPVSQSKPPKLIPPPLEEDVNEEHRYFGPGSICRSCESQISPEEIWCPNCKAPIVKRYCADCKQLIPDNAGRCPFCNTHKVGRFRYIRHLEQFIAATVVVGFILFLAALYVPDRKTTVAEAPKKVAQQTKEPVKQSGDQRVLQTKNQFKQKPGIVPAVSNRIKDTSDRTIRRVEDVVPSKANSTVETEQPEHQNPQESISQQEAAGQEPQSWYTNARRLNGEGFELMKEGRYVEAVPVLAQALRSFPPNAKRNLTYAYALYNLGRSLRLAGRPDLAIPILEERLKFANQRDVVSEELEQAKRDLGTPEEVYQ